MIISSQRHIDPEILAAKREARDYVVLLSEPFEVSGESYRVVLDGHHSMAAAREDGVEPEYETADGQQDDARPLLAQSVDDYLAAHWIDSDWYDVETGRDVRW